MEITQDKLLEDLSGFNIRKTGLMTRFIPKTEAHIISKIKEFSADDQKRLLNGKLKTMDTVIEVAANITGASSIYEMINGQVRAVGICSLDKGVVDTGDNYSVDTIIMQAARESSNTDVKVANFREFGIAPSMLKNAEVTIWADTRLVLKYKLSAILNYQIINSHHSILKLQKPILLKSQEQLEIKIEFPKGTSIPTTAQYFVKFLLVGVKTTKR